MPRGSIADHLLQAKAITPEQYEGAVYRLRAYGGRIEEHLLEMGAISEDDLLKNLAALHRTRYVGTEKLKKVNLDRSVLDRMPARVVEATGFFPILWDAEKRVLSVVTADPDNLEALNEVRAAGGARDVQPFVARPAAVKALISRWYHGDIHAFAALDTKSFQDLHQMMDVYERHLLDEGAMAAAVVDAKHRERTLTGADIERAGGRSGGAAAGRAEDASTVAVEDYLETLNVLVSLVENTRGELRGHSLVTARHVRMLGERIGLLPMELKAVTAAAYLHDLGKGSPFHLTSLNVAEWEGHRDAAMKRYLVPTRLFESVNLPAEAVKAISHMYERFDGGGFPDRLRGKDIPLGARLLSLCDVYADLTLNPRNPFRRTLSTGEAMSLLDRYRDTVFDGNLIDLLRIVVGGADIKQRILTGFRPILLVDDDPEQSTVLELRLMGRGFDVKVARSADAAIRLMVETDIDLVVTEVDLDPFDGFELMRRARGTPKTANLPFLFFTSRSSAEDVSRGFELGAADYVVKPSTTEVLVAKIRKIVDQQAAPRAGGVSGSLRELSLPDLVQVLSQGRKTGQLKVTAANNQVGEIHFVDGRIVNALFQKLYGEDAFYSMLRITEGAFALDPAFRPQSVTINAGTESLLLEGLRRVDEGI